MDTKTSAFFRVFMAMVAITIVVSGKIYPVSAEKNINSDPPDGWVETRFIIGPSGYWDPIQGEVALCWGDPRFLNVFGPEDLGEVLHGDACRMFKYGVPSSKNIEQLTAWWQYSLTEVYGPEWPISYVNGNLPPYFETFLPLVAR